MALSIIMDIINHLFFVIITGVLVSFILYVFCRILEIGRHHIRKHCKRNCK